MSSDKPATLSNKDGGAVYDYKNAHYWSDRRLIETYQRSSRDLRRRGFDERTVHRMGRVEETLRDRDIDPERGVRQIWDG